ncbi:MAG TPA: ATP-grasp domain-containing protein, partial [Gemmatimonadaceae bacterium]|nr:ATP-grasp domain-containing protein [Gemmatimonadaceae bacterium]
MNVLMIAPGYPDEMPLFCRGLSTFGARVYGISDVPVGNLPEMTRHHLSGYLQTPQLNQEDAVVSVVASHWRGMTFDRVVCLWEPGVVLAAKLRAALGVPGMTVDDAIAFRNKDIMKARVAAAGIRTPRHRGATSAAEVREAAEFIGYPLIIKPIDGAGSMDTFRVDDAKELDVALKRLTHVDHVNVEEFIEAEEFTFDTICVNGEMQFFNVGFYRPRPLTARSVEWISPQTLCLRDVDSEWVKDGVQMGHDVLKAMNPGNAFTHMEWYRKADGEVVFGEIAARPPGARTVDLMNYVSDVDLYMGYAEAELRGTFSVDVTRKYNAINIFKRAQGQGTIRRITGLEQLVQRFGEHIVHVDLLPVGATRRDWVLTLISDGYVTIRHPDFEQACAIADAIGTDLQLYAS